MTVQSNLQITGQDFTPTLSKSFLTALALLSDANAAEALVANAIQNVESECVTSESIRAAVINRLVQIQVSGVLCSSDTVIPAALSQTI